MQRRFQTPSPATRIVAPSLGRWVLAAHATMALVVIILLTLTLAAAEEFLSGGRSLSALEATSLISQGE